MKAKLKSRHIRTLEEHDFDLLFSEARERQKHSGHPFVNLQKRKFSRRKA